MPDLNLSELPQHIQKKARRYLGWLEEMPYHKPPICGKRHEYDRTVISIAISRKYRLLCRWNGERAVPRRVVTHETYNRTHPGSLISA